MSSTGPDDENQAGDGPGDSRPVPARLEFFWRPGCPFCAMLERDLVQARIPLSRRNIWEDPEAAEAVRAAADGNETVPTVRVAGHSLVNPPAAAVVALLGEVAPELLPRP